MSIDEAALAAELRQRQGVSTSARLAALGIGRRAIDALKRQGRLRRVGPGVVAATAWPDSREHQMAIACAVTEGVVCYPTAGEVWALRKSRRSPDVHVAISEGHGVHSLPGVQVHHTCYLPDVDVVVREDGIRVTSPPRTAFDAAWWLDDDDYESLVEDGLRRYYTLPTLLQVGGRLRERGRPGSARFREIVVSRDPTLKPVDSDYELRLERALRKRGFPRLERQCRVELLTGKVIHPDLGLPMIGLYIEVDHRTWHDGRFDADYDCRRDLEVTALGEEVVRVSDVAIDRYLERTVEALWTIYQRHLYPEMHRFGASRSADR